MSEPTARFTLASMITLITLTGAMALWAGSVSSEVQQTRQEYGEVLREVREMRAELHEFQLQQARLHGVQSSLAER